MESSPQEVLSSAVVILAPAIWAILVPLLTQLLKALATKVIATVPKQIIPVAAGAVGGLTGLVAEVFLPGLGMGIVNGSVAGLAGTGLHQVVKLNKEAKTAAAAAPKKK